MGTQPESSEAARCRSCGLPSARSVLDLGLVPPSDAFPLTSDPTPDEAFPLSLFRCDDCSLLQLGPDAVLAPEVALAVDSSTAQAHALASVAAVLREEGLSPGSSVIELDSGHGSSWLPLFLDAGLVAEPPTGMADLVVDVHYLMHEPSLDAVLQRHRARVRPGGAVVCEFFYPGPMVAQGLVDTIRHGHFVYLSLAAALPAFARSGLTVTRAVEVDVYGGSLRVTARATSESPVVTDSVTQVLAAEQATGLGERATLDRFADKARKAAEGFRTWLVGQHAEGRRVAAYGAPSKAAVLLAVAGVDHSLLPFTVDLSPAKAGRRIPVAGVPIRPVEALLQERPDVVVVLTWDIADEIRRQLARMSEGTGWTPRLFVPLPEPREVTLTS